MPVNLYVLDYHGTGTVEALIVSGSFRVHVPYCILSKGQPPDGSITMKFADLGKPLENRRNLHGENGQGIL